MIDRHPLQEATLTGDSDDRGDIHVAPQTAVIYGAGSAIGGAVGRAFARHGATLFLAGRTLVMVDAVATDNGPPRETAMSTLPLWAQAAVWGTVAGSGLLVGLLMAYSARPGHGAIARVMSFGAGALLSTASIQLTISAQLHAGTARATIFLLTGAALFSGVNAWLAQAGAKNRTRCGECVPQDNERDTPGSGRAIAIGTIIDALPEGLVLGIAITQGAAPAVAVVAGFFLANVPESLSGSAGMHLAGRSGRYIVSVWGAASLVTPLAAVLGSLLLADASAGVAGALDALSGGILLALAMETMIPEAFEKVPLFSGTIAVLGFAIIAALAVVGFG